MGNSAFTILFAALLATVAVVAQDASTTTATPTTTNATTPITTSATTPVPTTPAPKCEESMNCTECLTNECFFAQCSNGTETKTHCTATTEDPVIDTATCQIKEFNSTDTNDTVEAICLKVPTPDGTNTTTQVPPTTTSTTPPPITPPTTIDPNSTTTTTTPSPTPTPAPAPPAPNSTTTSVPTTTTPTTNGTTTTALPVPTTSGPPAPSPISRHFDAPSFFGGMILAIGLAAVAFLGFKFYKTRLAGNYHTL